MVLAAYNNHKRHKAVRHNKARLREFLRTRNSQVKHVSQNQLVITMIKKNKKGLSLHIKIKQKITDTSLSTFFLAERVGNQLLDLSHSKHVFK